MAGVGKMERLPFVFWNVTGAIAWGLAIGLLAYYGGKAAADAVQRYGLYAVVIIAVLLGRWLPRPPPRQAPAQDEVARRNRRRHAEPTSGMLAAISRALEERDQTQGHGARVAAFAEPLAHRLGWTAERIAALRFGAVHHDIGKVVVRRDVLRKPGR